MKKLFLTAALMCGAMAAFAEDVVQVVPFKATPGVEATEANYDLYTFSLNLKNDTQKTNIIKFTMYVPEGLKIETAWDDPASKTYYGVEVPEGCPRTSVKQGPKTVATKHEAAMNHTESDMPGFERYVVLISQGTTTVPFGGTDGEVAVFHYTTSAGLAAGVYPIYLKDVEITDQVNKIKLPVANTTSYFVVGEPTEASFAVKGVVPSWVNTALAEQTGIANLDLSEATDINGDFTYVDSREVVAPADVTTSVKYVGNNANYYSVNVPFAADVTGTGEVYEFASTDGKFAHFDKVTSVDAGKTYLAKGEVTLAANSAKVATVQTKNGQSGNYVKDGVFYHGTGLIVKPMRGLFEGASLSNLRVVIDGVLTNITTAQIEAGETSYDLQGRQTNNAKNGVFVVNGKKQFVK